MASFDRSILTDRQTAAGFWQAVAGYFAALAVRYRRALQLQDLRGLDQHLLDDIGVTRLEADSGRRMTRRW